MLFAGCFVGHKTISKEPLSLSWLKGFPCWLFCGAQNNKQGNTFPCAFVCGPHRQKHMRSCLVRPFSLNNFETKHMSVYTKTRGKKSPRRTICRGGAANSATKNLESTLPYTVYYCQILAMIVRLVR